MRGHPQNEQSSPSAVRQAHLERHASLALLVWKLETVGADVQGEPVVSPAEAGDFALRFERLACHRVAHELAPQGQPGQAERLTHIGYVQVGVSAGIAEQVRSLVFQLDYWTLGAHGKTLAASRMLAR